jgi:hypothetical protein
MKYSATLFFSLFLFVFCYYTSVAQTANSNNGSAKKHLTDSQLLTLVEKQTFQYFWDGAEPTSGLARERYHVDGEYPQDEML